jgi:Spy/CpxP family protein refolding chaperone
MVALAIVPPVCHDSTGDLRMRTKVALLISAVAFIAACERSVTNPVADESAVLAFDQQATLDSVSLVPRGPFFDTGGMPDSLKLTTAQEAAIKALHDAFAAAHKTQFDQLKAMHDEAMAAVKAGKARADVMTILAKTRPLMEAMRADFAALQAAVAAILTPAQKAWAAAHQHMGPGPMGGPMMPGRP